MHKHSYLDGWHIISRFAGNERPKLYLGYGLKILETLLDIVPLFISYLLISALMNAASIQEGLGIITWSMLALILIYVIKSVLGFVAVQLITKVGLTSLRNLRVSLMRKATQIPLGDLFGPSYKSIGSLASEDLLLFEMFPTQIFPSILAFVVYPVALVGLLFWIKPTLGGILLLTLPLVSLFFWKARTHILKLNKDRSRSMSDLNFRLSEYVQGIKVYRTLGAGPTQCGELHGAINDFRKANTSLVTDLVPLLIAQALALELAPFLVIAVGLHFVIAGMSGLPALILAIALAFQFSEVLRSFSSSLQIYTGAGPAIARVSDLLNRQKLPEPDKELSASKFDLTFENVGLIRDGTPILNDITLTIPHGSFVGIVGKSGAGKSSLLRMVARFWDVSHGSIKLGGKDLREIGSEELYRHLSIALQDVNLFNGSVHDNIAMGDSCSDENAIRHAADLCACDSIAEASPLELGRPVGTAGAKLSGGERQRISLARAVLKKSPILLLDEVTASLDSDTEDRIMDNLVKDAFHGRTVLMVAHRLNTLVNADRILVFDDGKIVETGNHSDLLDLKGHYYSLWQER